MPVIWLISLDSGAIGFGPSQRTLAPDVTFHPGFNYGSRGAYNRDAQHPHLIVSIKNDSRIAGMLTVGDIRQDAKACPGRESSSS